jgi:hypothetical protein
MSEASATAAEAIVGSQITVTVTTPDAEPPDDLPEVHFPRLSVERRVLGAINDGWHSDRLGPRNSLPALADFLITDPSTVNPSPPNARLEIEGLALADQVQLVLDNLERLIEAGLVVRVGDINDPGHTYHLTDAGTTELES